MHKIIKRLALGASLLFLIQEVHAIVGAAPGGSVVRRRVVVGTTVAVASTSANAAAASKPPPPPPPAAAPAAGPVGPPPPGTMVTTLPPGCAPTILNGVEYQRCGSSYYRAQMQGSNLVFVVTQP